VKCVRVVIAPVPTPLPSRASRLARPGASRSQPRLLGEPVIVCCDAQHRCLRRWLGQLLRATLSRIDVLMGRMVFAVSVIDAAPAA
jgi:hypothetical protein